MLTDGHYRTANGSEMWVSKNGGRSRVEFDWFEEAAACCDCRAEPYDDEGYLVWDCDYHEGGSSKLERVESEGDE